MIKHEKSLKRFSSPVEGGPEAVLLYREVDSETLDFYSTQVPPEARGQGLAAKLVEAGLTYARAGGFKVIPTCSYVAAYLQKHSEHQDLRKS